MLMPSLPRALCVACLVMGSVVPAFAQATLRARTDDTVRTATRLGGPSRFYGPVRDRAALQRMMRNRRAQQGLQEVLQATGLGSVSGQVIQILTDASPTQVTEVDFPVGGTMAWMALRRNGRADVVRTIRWGGRRPFKAFQLTLDDMNRYYTFVVPEDCGNLALVSDEPSREKARLDAERERTEAAARAAQESAEAAARAERERAEAARLALQQKADAEARHKARLAEEEAAGERQAAEALRIAAEQRANAEADRARLEREKVDWFVGGFVGKERMARGADSSDAVCAPLVGVKAGPDFRLAPDVRLSPAAGVAINTDNAGRSRLFAEVEIRRELVRGFIGGGIGVWDLTHSDTVAPNLLVDFGLLLNEDSHGNTVYFVGEGRLLLNELDDIANNYQFWGGIRYIFR